MTELKSWAVVTAFCAQYLLSRARLAKRPNVDGILEEVHTVFRRALKWRQRLVVKGADHCVKHGAAVFFSNHLSTSDPFYLYGTISAAKGKAPRVSAMMRDDFFDALPLGLDRALDLNGFLECIGVFTIAREKVQLSQLKPFLRYLDESALMMMYPSGTRSRSGALVEYRSLDQEPGGISFFIHQTQRRHPDWNVPAIPVTRTLNPVTRQSTMVFGPPLYIEHGAGRDERRSFDGRAICALAPLVDLNVPIILGALLYLRCLHQRDDAIAEERLYAVVEEIMTETSHAYVNAADLEDIPKAVDRALAYPAAGGMLECRGGQVRPASERVLSSPKLDSKYRRRNPVKHLANQILHLPEVVGRVETSALEL